MILAASGGGNGETIAFFVIGVLGIAISAAVFLVPQLFDAATRWRLRMQDMDENNERTLARDRERRRFIAIVLGVGSTVILMQGVTKL